MNTVYEDNLCLSQFEYRQQHIYLRSQPRTLSLVLGNACNIYCPHCYQSKNGDNLLRPPEIGRELRREFMGLYPYLSTLRVLGGETFAYAGFRELIEDAAASVRRPIVSVSTNGTLIDEDWAERIVRLPFSNVTVSIDGGTPATYARLRRGADLGDVLANVGRIQRWKQKLGSELPHLDSFFVIMRSNFREIPQYLDLMSAHGFSEITLQTIEINSQNLSREPALERDEVIMEAAEIRELHRMMQDLLPSERRRFRMIRTSGMTSLFTARGLDGSFLREEVEGLYPDSDNLVDEANDAGPSGEAASTSLCPNPWTTLFVAENGNVHLCCLADPIGNLYETPLSGIWNCQKAIANRSDIISGRYLKSGCSARWCSWREGKTAAPPRSAEVAALRAEMMRLVDRAAQAQPLVQIGEAPPAIAAVRRLLASRDQCINELKAMFVQLCDKNAALHERGQKHITHLESKAEAAVAESCRLEREFTQYREDQLRTQKWEAELVTARESVARFRQDQDPFSHRLAQSHGELQRHAELEQEYEALEKRYVMKRYVQLLEEHILLQRQVAMASRSRWCALGRMFGIGPRFG
jgi:MoaA/NifB/PqqE/SkfB family radical SAM enzyme